MRIIIWTILWLLRLPPLRRTNNAQSWALCAAEHSAYLFVNLGTEVILNIRFKPLETCPYTLDAVLRYDLPPNYNNTPINYTSATCNSTIDCGGEVIRCVNPTQPISCFVFAVSIRAVRERKIWAGDRRLWVSPQRFPRADLSYSSWTVCVLKADAGGSHFAVPP